MNRSSVSLAVLSVYNNSKGHRLPRHELMAQTIDTAGEAQHTHATGTRAILAIVVDTTIVEHSSLRHRHC
jgi:hypothetical protein